MRRHFHLVGFAAAQLAILAGLAVAAPKPRATVQKPVRGTLEVQRSGRPAFVPLAAGEALYIGDIVRTGRDGKATLLFHDGSLVRLKERTSIEVTARVPVGKGKRSLLRVLLGEIWARLRPGTATETPSVVAGVSGTELHLDVVEDGTTTLTVLTGEVDFFNEHGAVVVGESEFSVARPGQAPTAPVTIENASFVVEWTLDLEHSLIPREKFFVTSDRKALAEELARREGHAQGRQDDSAARRDYGEALFDAGRYAEALREFRESDRLTPGQPSTLVRLGESLLALGRFDEAERSFALATSAAPLYAEALTGGSALALARGRPGEAERLARQAVAADSTAVEPSLMLGLSLMRQPGRLAEARSALQTALAGEPATRHYQAHALLAMVRLAQDDPSAALGAAERAVRLAPRSSLVHGTLALAHFFNDNPLVAERESRVALELDPDSVAARCALGQALLAQGEVDEATRAGAQAVALDPSSIQARYLLGIAEAQRRDFRHAVGELTECRRLAPDFLRAASALARVYTRMGRQKDAIAVLNELLPRHRETDRVLAALGDVYYRQARYADAASQYRQALELKPNSALYHAELARVLLDANRLNESIHSGQQAVRLAPDVGQYHATLGLAYDYGGLNVQAEREYRTALAVDPHNALAHLQLGLKSAQTQTGLRQGRFITKRGGQRPEDRLKEGLQAAGDSPAVSSITQAFLHHPAISTDLVRGGTTADLTLGVGADHQRRLVGTHLGRAGDRLHALGYAVYEGDSGARPNDATTRMLLSENLTLTLDSRTTVFARMSHRRTREGLPGAQSLPDLDDRIRSQDSVFQLAVRRRLRPQVHLWAGLTRPSTRFELIDAAGDSSLVTIVSQTGIGFIFFAPRQVIRSQSLIPELRLELALGGTPARPDILAIGVTRAAMKPTISSLLVSHTDPPVFHPVSTRLDGEFSLAYAQWTQTLSKRLSFAVQLRRQHLRLTGDTDLLGGGVRELAPVSKSHWLPSLVANYQPDGRTMLRLFANRQAQEHDLLALGLLPRETLLSTEPLILPQGSPDRTRTVEIEAERYVGSSGFLKLFVYRTSARGVDLATLPTMDRVSRSGIGLRYERQLNRNLFGQVGLLHARTTNTTPSAPYSGDIAPYHPKHIAGLGLNYIDASGTKAGLQVNYTGSFFQDTGVLSDPTRHPFASRAYVDLTLAKEPSVHREYFLKVFNLFNTRAIEFNDYPINQRRVEVGVTSRF